MYRNYADVWIPDKEFADEYKCPVLYPNEVSTQWKIPAHNCLSICTLYYNYIYIYIYKICSSINILLKHDYKLLLSLVARSVKIEKHVQNITVNFGPQHPAAHGVLRLVMTLDGEVNTNALPLTSF